MANVSCSKENYFGGEKKKKKVEKLNQYYLIFLPLSGCSQLIDIAQAALEQTNQSRHGTVTGSASLQPMISYLPPPPPSENAFFSSGRNAISLTNVSAGGDTPQRHLPHSTYPCKPVDKLNTKNCFPLCAENFLTE